MLASDDPLTGSRLATSGPPFIVGSALFVLLLGANLPAPLYHTYQERFGFSTVVLTLVFATYAAVLIPSLIIFGQLSDRIGRKPVIIGALGVAAIGLVLFAAAQSTVWLFAARAAQGLAIGCVSATAAAALVELDPDRDERRAALGTVIGYAGGAAAAPLLAAALAEWGPWPQTLCYLFGLVATGLVAVAVMRLPESETRGGRWQLQRPSVPSELRSRFTRASLAGSCGWAVGALFLSLVPSYTGTLLDANNLVLLALPTAAMLTGACTAHALSLGLETASSRLQLIGLASLVAGLAVIVVASRVPSLGALLLAATLSGIGLGLGFGGSQADINRLAPDDRRGEVTAAYTTFIYVGVAFVAITAGWLGDRFGLSAALNVAATTIALVSIGTAAWLARSDWDDTRRHKSASSSTRT